MSNRRAGRWTVRLAAHAGAATIAVALVATPALASFTSSRSATASYSTAVLAAPTSLATSAGPCTIGVAASVKLTWTATTSSWADGYEIARSLVAGGPYTTIGTVSGVSTTTYTDSSTLFATLYRYVVRATKVNWRSVNSNEASLTTLTALCT